MMIEDTEKELAEAGYVHKPEDDNSISIEELLYEIGEMFRKMDANLKRRVEQEEPTVVRVLGGIGKGIVAHLNSLLPSL
jgi:hypothetical protein